MKTEQAVQVWQDSLFVAQLLHIDPHGFGGVWIKSSASDVRNRWWQFTQDLFGKSSITHVPASVDDEALLGGIDLTKTLSNGSPVYQIGILENPQIRLLKLTMAERLRSSSVSYVTQAFDASSSKYGMAVFDESTPDEAAVAQKLIDRCAFQVRFDGLSYFVIDALETNRFDNIDQIRKDYQQVVIPTETIESIVRTGLAFGISSIRAVLFVVKAVRALTAIRGVEVPVVEDIQTAIRLIFTHRITALPSMPEESSEEPENDQEPENPPPEPEQENEPPPMDQNDPTDHAQTEVNDPKNIPQEDLEEMLIEAAKAYLPADILDSIMSGRVTNRVIQQQQGKSGSTQMSYVRGFPLPARKGVRKSGQKIDFLKTLQAASPWQKIRRQDANQRMAFKILPEDIHIKRFEQRKTTLTLFVVDASGSSALERLSEAKGAVELLLAQCYVRRDEVALMTFRTNRAELILPPTRSLVRAKRLLTMMPGGGGTPLALAIHVAGNFLAQIQNNGQTPMMVLMTDARANVSLAGVGGREQAFADAILAANTYRGFGIKSILVDTAIMPQANAKNIADALGAIYVPLPQGKSAKVAEVAKQLSK